MEEDNIEIPEAPSAPEGMRESLMEGGEEESEEEYPSRPARRTTPGETYQEKYAQSEPSFQPDRFTMDQIQAMVESIIDERWQEVVANVGDITIWKSRINDDVTAVKQEILRTQKRIDELQKVVLGKVEEYGQGVRDVGSDMRALEKVFEKIVNPLTQSVKELSKITKDMKKKQ